jgi:hypothetical protein
MRTILNALEIAQAQVRIVLRLIREHLSVNPNRKVRDAGKSCARAHDELEQARELLDDE